MKTQIIAFLLAVAGLVSLSACESPGCLIQNEGALIGSTFVATNLECTNQALMQQDLNAYLSAHTGICASPGKDGKLEGPLANTFCPLIAAGVVEFVKSEGAGFLAKYGCSAASASTIAVDGLTALCEKLPLSPQK